MTIIGGIAKKYPEQRKALLFSNLLVEYFNGTVTFQRLFPSYG